MRLRFERSVDWRLALSTRATPPATGTAALGNRPNGEGCVRPRTGKSDDSALSRGWRSVSGAIFLGAIFLGGISWAGFPGQQKSDGGT
jgi:hypothetical protein